MKDNALAAVLSLLCGSGFFIAAESISRYKEHSVDYTDKYGSKNSREICLNSRIIRVVCHSHL